MKSNCLTAAGGGEGYVAATYDRHMERYWEMDAQCGLEMMAMFGMLR